MARRKLLFAQHGKRSTSKQKRSPLVNRCRTLPFIFSNSIFNQYRRDRPARYLSVGRVWPASISISPSLTERAFFPILLPEAHSPDLQDWRPCDRAHGRQLRFCWADRRPVKIRGFRIEMGEIESALRQCEGVRAPWCERSNWRRRPTAGRVCDWRRKFSHGADGRIP